MATIDALPIETHPMTQLSVGMLALQKDHGRRVCGLGSGVQGLTAPIGGQNDCRVQGFRF